MENFWTGKIPCWDFVGCTQHVYSRCSAYQNKERPCWEIAGTECRKVLNFEWECQDCKVFMRYGRRPTPGYSRPKRWA